MKDICEFCESELSARYHSCPEARDYQKWAALISTLIGGKKDTRDLPYLIDIIGRHFGAFAAKNQISIPLAKRFKKILVKEFTDYKGAL